MSSTEGKVGIADFLKEKSEMLILGPPPRVFTGVEQAEVIEVFSLILSYSCIHRPSHARLL